MCIQIGTVLYRHALHGVLRGRLPTTNVCVPSPLRDEGAHVQCPLGSGQDQAQVPLLLLDLIDLEAGQAGRPGSLDAEETRAPFLLLPDPAVPEQVFVRSATAAWSVCLTWLPALTSWLSEGTKLVDTGQAGPTYMCMLTLLLGLQAPGLGVDRPF